MQRYGGRRGASVLATASDAAPDHIVHTLARLGTQVLKARQEEDFLADVATTLRACADCDTVIVRLLEQYIQTRVVVTRERVQAHAPGEIMEPFTQEDQEEWLSVADGVFREDVRTAPSMKPLFHRHVLDLGLTSTFKVPLLRDTEICGQVIFGWTSPVCLDDRRRAHLRRLADYAALMTTLFQLKTQQSIDSLTGLLNRWGLRRRWPVCAQAPRGALLFADLDGLKALNDTWGHLAGDDFLRSAARAFRKAGLSRSIVISRFSGVKFVIVAPGAEPAEAHQLAEGVADEFQSLLNTLPPPHPMLAVGTAYWPDDGTDLRQLIERAERNMSAQKKERIGSALRGEPWPASELAAEFWEGWLTNSPDGVIITDAARKVLYVNPVYERLSGYRLKEWIGKRPKFIASGKTRREVYEAMWRCIAEHGSWTGRVINRRPSGEEWVCLLRITRIVDRGGRLVGYIGQAQDVTKDEAGKAQEGEVPLEGA